VLSGTFSCINSNTTQHKAELWKPQESIISTHIYGKIKLLGKGNTKLSKECPGENWVVGRGKSIKIS